MNRISLRLNYSHTEIAQIIQAECVGKHELIVHSITIDSRSIVQGNQVLFFCLKGKRDGIDFIEDAHAKGCRAFVVNQNAAFELLPDAIYFKVDDPLLALQRLAAHHRTLIDYPVIGITGSAGKTIVKEWL